MPTAAEPVAKNGRGAMMQRSEHSAVEEVEVEDHDDGPRHPSTSALPSSDDDVDEASLYDQYQDNDTALYPDDPRVLATVKLLSKTTGLELPKAMRAEGFNEADSRDVRKQMWVRRRMGSNCDGNGKVAGNGGGSGNGRGKGSPKGTPDGLLKGDVAASIILANGAGAYKTAEDGSEGTVYYAVRSGRARIDVDSSFFDSEDVDSVHPPGKKRKRNATTPASAKTTPVYVEIRSAIFLRWEDARRFVAGDNYAACHSLEEAREYLLAGEKKGCGGGVEDEALAAFLAAQAAGEEGLSDVGDMDDGETDGKSRKIEAFVARRASEGKGVAGNDVSKAIAETDAATDVAGSGVVMASSKSGKKVYDHGKSAGVSTAAAASATKTSGSLAILMGYRASELKAASHWDAMYNDLVEYKKSHGGSIEIPESAAWQGSKSTKALRKKLTSLRAWCDSQKRQLVDWSQGRADGRWCPGQKLDVNELNEERIEKLKEIGFTMPPTYDEMYARLAAHKAEMGALDVNYAVDKELYEWTAEQRKMLAAHYRGERVPLSEERIRNLESLGFKLGRIDSNGHTRLVDTGLVDRQWDSMLQALVKWKEDRGSFTFPSKPALKVDRSLKGWYDRQKQEYKKLQNGEESTLTARRLQKLTAVPGLNLNPRERIPWEERMRSLREFKAEHGHCRPPRQSGLGDFVRNVRTLYRQMQEGKTNCLTDERVNDLLELGFEFRVGKVRRPQASKVSWEERFQALLAFKAEHGHVNVTKQHDAHLDIPLGTWVRDQRAAYQLMKKGKKTHMNPEKALRLSELGFTFDASRNKVLNRESSAATNKEDADY